MEQARKSFWAQAFPLMMAVWPWLEPTVLRIQVWDEALSDFSVDQLMAGVSYVIRNHSSTHTPTPGEVRDALLGPITKCAVKDTQGRVIRWSARRLTPNELKWDRRGSPAEVRKPLRQLTSGIEKLNGRDPHVPEFEYEGEEAG